MALVNHAVGSLCAPQKVHNALVMVDVVCMALTTEPSKLSKSVWSPLAVGHFTGPRLIQLKMALVHLCDQCVGRLGSWCGVTEGEKWMHGPHGTSMMTLEHLSITTTRLQARCTELLTDSMVAPHGLGESCRGLASCTPEGAQCSRDGGCSVHGTPHGV